METLKRKKMYEGQRDQMAGQQFNIEQTSFAIDSIKDTATTVKATAPPVPTSPFSDDQLGPTFFSVELFTPSLSESVQ